MPSVEQITNHRFPSGLGKPIGGLSVRIDNIVDRFGLKLEEWDEDGLGLARGLGIKLPSGRIVLLQELAHAIKLGSRAPDVIADAGDIISTGVDPLLIEVVEALGLSKEAVAWVAPESIRELSAKVLEAAKIGKRAMSVVTVVPQYGYGWQKSGQPIDTPDPFNVSCEMCEKADGQDVHKLIVGRVFEPRHMFDGLWVILTARTLGSDPTYNVLLYPQNPPFSQSGSVRLFDVPRTFDGFAGLKSS